MAWLGAIQTAKEPSVAGYVGDEGGVGTAALDFWVVGARCSCGSGRRGLEGMPYWSHFDIFLTEQNDSRALATGE